MCINNNINNVNRISIACVCVWVCRDDNGAGDTNALELNEINLEL